MSEPRSGTRWPWLQWVAFVGVFVAVYSMASRGAELPLVGEEAPNVTLPVAAGATEDSPLEVSLSSLKGGVVVLDFWASWCTACRRATPILNELNAEFEDRGVMFYAINVEPIDRQRLQAAHLSFGTGFPSLHDRGGTAQRRYSVEMLPTVVVVGPDGMVKWAESGVPRRSALRNAISEALN
ncbi:MAG: TlpA disulfide reductase family protein [Myxococcota bacterium]